jgi:hypothetical protein
LFDITPINSIGIKIGHNHTGAGGIKICFQLYS